MTEAMVTIEGMKEIDFYRGWLVLLSQPYGKRYAEHDEEEKIQAAMYKKHLIRFSKEAWEEAVEKWVVNEKKWPTLPDLIGACRAYEKAHRPAIMHGTVAGRDDDGEPFRSILMEWASVGGRFCDLAVKRIDEWLVTHPNDADALAFRARQIAVGAVVDVDVKTAGRVTPSSRIMGAMEAKEGG
ncbi:MAG: hypothetical protein ACREI9_05715 [Nitrospiraceae bacterium]